MINFSWIKYLSVPDQICIVPDLFTLVFVSAVVQQSTFQSFVNKEMVVYTATKCYFNCYCTLTTTPPLSFILGNGEGPFFHEIQKTSKTNLSSIFQRNTWFCLSKHIFDRKKHNKLTHTNDDTPKDNCLTEKLQRYKTIYVLANLRLTGFYSFCLH